MEKDSGLTMDQIEDVRILIKVKGKHYSVIAKEDKAEALELRKITLNVLLNSNHVIVGTALEDIHDNRNKRKNRRG